MFQPVTINSATLARGAHAAFDQVFQRRPVENTLRTMLFGSEEATGFDDDYVTFGTLERVGKKLNGEGNPTYLNFNQYKRTVSIEEFGAAVAVTKQQIKIASRIDGGRPFLNDWNKVIKHMSQDVDELWLRFAEDALLGTTTYLKEAIASPDGSVATLFSTAGHFGGKLINDFNGETSYSHAQIRAEHKAMKDAVMGQQDDQGRNLHEFEPRGFIYLVDPQEADEYRTALKGKVFAVSPVVHHTSGSLADSTAGVAAIDNFLTEDNVAVIGWAPLRNQGYAFVRVLDQGEGLADNPPLQYRTFEEPELITDEKKIERATVTAIHHTAGARAGQVGGIFRIDKT